MANVGMRFEKVDSLPGRMGLPRGERESQYKKLITSFVETGYRQARLTIDFGENEDGTPKAPTNNQLDSTVSRIRQASKKLNLPANMKVQIARRGNELYLVRLDDPQEGILGTEEPANGKGAAADAGAAENADGEAAGRVRTAGARRQTAQA